MSTLEKDGLKKAKQDEKEEYEKQPQKGKGVKT